MEIQYLPTNPRVSIYAQPWHLNGLNGSAAFLGAIQAPQIHAHNGDVLRGMHYTIIRESASEMPKRGGQFTIKVTANSKLQLPRNSGMVQKSGIVIQYGDNNTT